MRVKNLTKSYDGKIVVDGVNFEIPKGKVLSLIGPNGAGKSTVMGMISRLIASDSGLIDFEGKSLQKWKSRELSKRLAILTQSNNIQILKAVAEGKTAIVGMVNAGGFSLLGNDGRCSIIGKEIGFENIGVDAKVDTSAHGNEASFEFVLSKNPDYIFVMDRDAAISTEGAKLAAEVLDNELINKTNAAQNGNVVVLEHSSVWYTAEGGITALGVMLSNLEGAPFISF